MYIQGCILGVPSGVARALLALAFSQRILTCPSYGADCNTHSASSWVKISFFQSHLGPLHHLLEFHWTTLRISFKEDLHDVRFLKLPPKLQQLSNVLCLAVGPTNSTLMSLFVPPWSSLHSTARVDQRSPGPLPKLRRVLELLDGLRVSNFFKCSNIFWFFK